MENKNLTAVFPHLKPPARLSDLMELSEVTRVTMNPENTLMCVYLASQQWIAKEDIYRLEECIEEHKTEGQGHRKISSVQAVFRGEFL